MIVIACRFVPYDQWFITRLDDVWKVRQAKHWLLSKCNLTHCPAPLPRRRSVSPITFTPSIHTTASLDSLDDGYNEDDEHSDQDLLPHATTGTPSQPQKPPQPGSSSLVNQYTLISFSTGTILEDKFALSWYNLRPYELLEMHSVGIIAPLHRDILPEYVQPYFQAKVRVLRAVWNHRSGRLEAPAIDALLDRSAKLVDPFPPPAKSNTSQSEKRPKAKIDWKARWVVINQGILSLPKGHVTNPPLHQFALSNMRALCGADTLERAFTVIPEPRVICIKFRPCAVSLPVSSRTPSLPSSPISEESKSNNREPIDSVPDTEQRANQENPDAYEGEGTWIVLDMLDDHAFSSILRVLHRQASCPLLSSFVTSPSVITVSHSAIPSTSFALYDTIPYPEWRINTVGNARKAGLGDVGKPMACVMWSDKSPGALMGDIHHHRHAFSQEMQYKTNADIYPGYDDDSDESEMEWEGWTRDLERQIRIKRRSEKACGSVAPRQPYMSFTSALPSPPLSEASPSGSPRVRSPSLSAYSHVQYPNVIGNVIQAGRFLEFPQIKSTTVSTVSVGDAPRSRQRSRTLTANASRREQDKGRQDREPFPSTSMHSARASTRTVSVSAGQSPSPRTFVRHVHSSSNLRMSSSFAPDSPMHPGSSSPSKRQGGFMRAMSLRAGKIVRGLESAIDFVDEKTAPRAV